MKTARSNGFSDIHIENHLKWFLTQKPKKLVLIESDEDFREILVQEIKHETNCEVEGISFEDFQSNIENLNANFTAMSDEEQKIQSVLPSNRTCIFLKSRSVPASMIGETRPKKEELIAVVSGWEKFLFWAKTILIAADIESESLIIRSSKEENWRKWIK